MADEIAVQLLGTDVRSSWCGDTDPTGRFVCRRIRDHALDWHAGRNDVGGIHQWPATPPAAVTTDGPRGCPVGTVLVDPKTGSWAVRFTRGDDTGKGQHVWLSPAGVVHAEARFLHHAEVRGWEVAEARRWGRVADDDRLVDGDLRQRCISALDELVSEFISPDEFGGYDIHYAELVDIVLDVVQPELADLRASREVWAIEAMGLDGLADKVLGWYSRAHEAVCRAVKLPASGTNVDDLVAAVARLASERDAFASRHGELAREKAKQADERWEARAQAPARPAIPADAAAYQDLLGAIWLHVSWRAVTRHLTTEQRELWADAIESSSDPDLKISADRWWRDDAPAPVSGSDTTAHGGEGE